MATETQDILLRLKLEGDAEIKKRNNELLKSITDNKKAIEENNAALKEYKKAGDTSSDAVNQLKLRNIELTASNRALNAELNNNIKILNNEVGSLNEKRALLNNMNAAYAKLSADQKANTAEGIAQGKAIRALTDELKAEEKALGDTRRNVGNYTDSIIEANSQLGLSGTILGKAITGYKAFKVAALEASGGTSVLNGALKLLAANPIFAIIAVIAGVFMLLKDAIERNASIVGQFTRALAPLQQILGVIFGVIGDVVKLLVGGFAKSMELVASLFGDAGKAANDYVKALADAAAAEKELFNLRIRQKEEQKVINNLMAVANNRIVEGKARYEAMTKAIEVELETARLQAKESDTIFKGTVARLEAEYNLKGQLMNKDMTLTKEANKKLSQEDKDLYREKLDQRIEFDEKESEIRKSSARKLGQIQTAIVKQEKEQRDLQIAAMADGLGKQLATIESNYTAQKQTVQISMQEQRKTVEAALKQNIELYKDDYAMQAKLSMQFYNDIKKINQQEAEQLKLIDAAQARERLNAQRNAAKQAADSRTALERQLQDAILQTYSDGYAKERTELLLSFQRKRDDLIKEAEFTGKNKKETAALVTALTEQYNAEALKMERENQKRINDLISGEAVARKEMEIQLRLDAVKEGSRAELELRIQQLNLQKEEEIKAADELGVNLNLIREKYRKQEEDMRLQFESDNRQKVLDETLLRYQNEIEIARQAGEDTIAMRLEAKQREIDNIQQLEGESNEQLKARRLQLQAELADIEQQGVDQRIQIKEIEFEVAATLMDGISALGDIYSKEQEKSAGFSKALAFFQIGLDAAMALSAAIANAQKAAAAGGPLAPALSVLYTAQAFTTVLTAIAKAKKLITDQPKAPGKATGGLITGEGTGTSDSIPVRLSNSESVLTAQSTGMFAPLLSGLNVAGGGVPIQSVNKSAEIMGEDFLARAFSKALVSMPAPVVDLQEFHRAEDRLAFITENAVK